MNRLAFSLAVVLMLSPIGARATQQGRTAIIYWKQMDICARQAQAAYPEYNAEANAKRDAKLKECLNAYGLPPRQPLSQPQSR